MRDHFRGSMIMVAIAAAAVGVVISVSTSRISAQAPTLQTAWGDPDLQGIWTDESDTPATDAPIDLRSRMLTTHLLLPNDKQGPIFEK